MTSDDLALFKREITSFEESRLKVYDDGTGKPLTKGMTLVGYPTIGIGRELSMTGISIAEQAYMLDNDVNGKLADLIARYPWFVTLDPGRQRAILNLAFNVGVAGVQMRSPEMVKAIIRGDFADAKAQLLDGPWKTQVGPRRSGFVAQLIETGSAQL